MDLFVLPVAGPARGSWRKRTPAMSSSLDHAALPPPHPGQQQAAQTSPLRRAFAVQPPALITTSLSSPHPASFVPGSVHSPASATSLSLRYAPMAANSPASYAPSPATTPMALRNPSAVPYNPQQWNRSGPVSGQHVPHAQQLHQTRLHEMTGMEGTYTQLLYQSTTLTTCSCFALSTAPVHAQSELQSASIFERVTAHYQQSLSFARSAATTNKHPLICETLIGFP